MQHALFMLNLYVNASVRVIKPFWLTCLIENFFKTVVFVQVVMKRLPL